MPYKWETDGVKLPRDKDRRVKLTEGQREEIRALYGTISQRKLAAMYGVSRRLITFIGAPEKHEENLKRRAERGGTAQYYDSKANTKSMREHRRYKTKVLDNTT